MRMKREKIHFEKIARVLARIRLQGKTYLRGKRPDVVSFYGSCGTLFFRCVDAPIAAYDFPALLSHFALHANGFEPLLGCLPISQ